MAGVTGGIMGDERGRREKQNRDLFFQWMKNKLIMY
jgi:hypothetical protein